MKKFFAVVLALSIFAWGCKERNELIITQPGDQFQISEIERSLVPKAQPKVVVIEDITGVRCVNCPSAQQEAKTIEEEHPGRVIVLSIHAPSPASLTAPYPESKQDFRITGTEAVLNLVGSPPALPIGAVDRQKFADQERILISYTRWNEYVTQQLGKNPPIVITLDSSGFTPSTSTYFLNATISFAEAVNGEVFLSGLLSESEIEDFQLTPGGLKENYIHNHVVRRWMQPYDGKLLASSPAAGDRFSVSLVAKLQPDWNPEQMQMVMMAHLKSNNSQEILQAAKWDIEN